MLQKLNDLCSEGELLFEGSDPVDLHSEYEDWVLKVSEWLYGIAPELGLRAEWGSLGRSPLILGGSYYDDPVTWNVFHSLIQRRLSWLSKVPSRIKKPSKEEDFDLWDIIHDSIASVAKPRFISGHYADAVEASYKQINSIIKKQVRELLTKELDGAALMNQVFSLNDPIIKLADLDTESGRNIQKGYMQIFAGAITGIRNPTAHDNVSISKEQAIHLIVLASLLMWQLDSAINLNKDNIE